VKIASLENQQKGIELTTESKSWFAKHWWKVTIIPAIFVFVFFVIKFAIVYITANIGIPDLSDLEKSFYKNQRKLDDSERDVLDMIIKERDELWKKIDEGNPTPGKIFDGEINNG